MTEGFATSRHQLEPGVARLVRGAGRRIALLALSARPRRFEPGVRIVHYHYVFDGQRDGFARQLELFANRLELVSLSEATSRLEQGLVSGRELVVTFDDGFRNQLENAVPVLDDYGISACFYLISELVSAPPSKAREICVNRILMPAPVEPMTWEDAQTLLRRGHEVGSHTRTHPDLMRATGEERRQELAGSRMDLARQLANDVKHFSAPFGNRGRFGPDVSAAARAAGYSSCATAKRGLNRAVNDVFQLRRHHLMADWPLGEVSYFLGL